MEWDPTCNGGADADLVIWDHLLDLGSNPAAAYWPGLQAIKTKHEEEKCSASPNKISCVPWLTRITQMPVV